MHPNLVFIILKYLGKRSQTYYMSDVLFTWFNDSKTTWKYCILEEEKKIKTKTIFMRLLFFAIFGKLPINYMLGLARFRFRREIHNQLSPLERFLATISSI